MLININKIEADENFNCRGQILFQHVKDLSESIKKEGLLQPVTVCNRKDYYELNDLPLFDTGHEWFLVVGFRRFQSCRLIGMEEIECVEIPAATRSILLATNLRENVQRLDLNMVQEANAVSKMAVSGTKSNWISAKIGKPKEWVDARLKLMEMDDPEIKEAAIRGRLTDVQVLRLARHEGEARKVLFQKILDGKGKKDIKKVKKVKAAEKKHTRKKSEMYDMMDYMEQIFGERTALNRVLAWAAGNISDYDLFCDFKNMLGDSYEIPEWSLATMEEINAGGSGILEDDFLPYN